MKYILDYHQLNEAKQVGIIYHFTSLENFHKIVNDNFMFISSFNGKNTPSISFSRKSDGSFFSTNMRMVRFTIDGDKLSTKYKLLPFADYEKDNWVRDYGRRPYDSEKDEAEIILISKKEEDYGGVKVNLKPYIIRIDIIYNNIFNKNFDEEREFLEKIDIPIFIHKETYSSVHEYPIIQKNISAFKDITAIPREQTLLPEAKALYDKLLISSKERFHYFNGIEPDKQYIDDLYDNDILHCGNIKYAIQFNSITEIANKLIKYKEKEDLSKYKCKLNNDNNKFIVYFFKNLL